MTGMIKRRFLAGKISLPNLLTTEDGKTKFWSSSGGATVVYDDCTSDVKDLGASHTVLLVIRALVVFGKSPYLLRGIVVAAERGKCGLMREVWFDVGAGV